MKKIIYKILKKLLKDNKVYKEFVKDIVSENTTDFIQELVKYPVFNEIVKEDLEIECIKNCILVNVNFNNCRIKVITGNRKKQSNITGSIFGKPIVYSEIKIPDIKG